MSERLDRILALIDDGFLEHPTQGSPASGPQVDVTIGIDARAFMASIREADAAFERFRDVVMATGTTFERFLALVGPKRRVPLKTAHLRRYSR